MSRSIFDIAKSVSWTEEGRFYLTQKDPKHELLAEYLSGFNLIDLEKELASIKNTMQVLNSNDTYAIERHFIKELHGFNEDSTAYVGGATDFSVTLIYTHLEHLTYLKHVYGEPNERYVISLYDVVIYLEQLKRLISGLLSATKTQEKSS